MRPVLQDDGGLARQVLHRAAVRGAPDVSIPLDDRNALILVHSAIGAVVAQEVVKKEPAMGAMKPGEGLLVDDGLCGPGKIKKVIGGDHVAVGGTG